MNGINSSAFTILYIEITIDYFCNVFFFFLKFSAGTRKKHN